MATDLRAIFVDRGIEGVIDALQPLVDAAEAPAKEETPIPPAPETPVEEEVG